MRAILFSGKSKKNGEWVTGKGVDVNWKDAYIIIPQIDGTVGWSGVDELEVDPLTVCQYTGLTDKNGKKIFEGDIVNREIILKDNKICFEINVVKWNNQEARFDLYCGEDFTVRFNYWIACHCEIIGNIHDNPELLGETNGY